MHSKLSRLILPATCGGWVAKVIVSIPSKSRRILLSVLNFMTHLAEIFADLHGYNLADRSWTNLSAPAAGSPPSARGAHGFAATENLLYVLSGCWAFDNSGFCIGELSDKYWWMSNNAVWLFKRICMQLLQFMLHKAFPVRRRVQGLIILGLMHVW